MNAKMSLQTFFNEISAYDLEKNYLIWKATFQQAGYQICLDFESVMFCLL